MHHPSDYTDAMSCVRNRRYTPPASFMIEGMVDKMIHRISPEQRGNLTRTAARKLRNTHARLLTAQGGRTAQRAMAEQAYRDVASEMAAAV
jgi:hypothetical protein